VASFTHDVEAALVAKKHITMVTLDVQGAFDALLPGRLLERMRRMGFHTELLRLIKSFLTGRRVRVRLEGFTTDYSDVKCGTPQGSPLSPILYILYLADLLNQDRTLRFGYADDVMIYRASTELDENIRLLKKDLRKIFKWGRDNKIVFAPEKMEMLHITRKRDQYAPSLTVDGTIITPITYDRGGTLPALRWLGVWFDRRLTFKRHVQERARNARHVAAHLRSLARVKHGPPASSLRKAVITCIVPVATYGVEAWYGGRTRMARAGAAPDAPHVSARVGWHINEINKALRLAARATIPVWRTTPTATVLRDAGLPSAEVALEEARHRFAVRIRGADIAHPLVKRATPALRKRGVGAGTQKGPRTKLQELGKLLPHAPRPRLVAPRFTPGCRTDPTKGLDKKTAAKHFEEWFKARTRDDLVLFSDGSELTKDGAHHVGYGWVIYRNGFAIAEGKGAINPQSHVFDAEAIGACKGLKHAEGLARQLKGPDTGPEGIRVWACIDSTSVIWSLQGNPSPTSQWAFLAAKGSIARCRVGIKWSPGHEGIEGNERADGLAKAGALLPEWDPGPTRFPTQSGIRTKARQMAWASRTAWWAKARGRLSDTYLKWDLPYSVRRSRAHDLPRQMLHHYLAVRTGHGDFSSYHRRFNHDDAALECTCGRPKTPEHLVYCRLSRRHYDKWPCRPSRRPSTDREIQKYLAHLMSNPEDFRRFCEVTSFYSVICPRFDTRADGTNT
jgi:ribonuclease HI